MDNNTTPVTLAADPAVLDRYTLHPERYALQSAPMIHAPSIIRYLKHMYATDPINAINAMAAGWGDLPIRVALAILDGSQAYTIDGNAVIVIVTK